MTHLSLRLIFGGGTSTSPKVGSSTAQASPSISIMPGLLITVDLQGIFVPIVPFLNLSRDLNKYIALRFLDEKGRASSDFSKLASLSVFLLVI